MDLITPARKWAAAEAVSNTFAHDAVDRMPAFQRVVMFFSVTVPFVALIVAVILLWRKDNAFGIGPGVAVVMAIMYALAGFGVTIGFHRLLTHKAFETYRPIRLLLAILGSSAAQGMCIKWCATHRRHHQVSDREGDPHSPHLHDGSVLDAIKGFYHAHVGWCFDADREGLARSVPDLTGDKTMLVIDQLYFLWVGLGLILPGVALGLITKTWTGFFSGMIWGGFVRVFLMQHVTWSVNSVCHVWGSRPFDSADHSANNFIVAILSLGEGWHNNHHAFPTSARHGLRWWQFDSSYVIIRAMAMLRLVWNVRTPNASAIEAKGRREVVGVGE